METVRSSEVLTADELQRAIRRLALELVERLGTPDQFVLVGIVTGGEILAGQLADALEALEGTRPVVGHVDITLYRDDLYTGLEKPVLGETALPFPVSGAGIVLVDDVLFTGRTVRAAFDELWDYGRPAWIKLLVLVDRGHRELPIAADFVGRHVSTERSDRVVVDFGANGGVALQQAPEGRT
ncbi:MAG: bifunctional pyr operon transcriptional regulator/uracil phosphoribosyltransferase [Deltaproteobacteria bacterium]|nr:bifunctional pyr operon transcriptional regulator/uracil phosphoribosyltransferase [Deltaproteobacteria bacterium]HCH66838.1 bifunctional pyr operon transcriptional regulator/uracil phosphoribosyltransferase PyrR [Deltaproteobacteria bacterium]